MWSDGITIANRSNLAAKSYSVTVKDGNQCIPPESNINLALTAPERDDWTATGNNNAGANSFIGTTSNYDFVMKANNNEALRLKTNGDALFSGKIGLGTNSPTAKLDITGGIRIRDINSLYTNLPMPTGTQRLVTTDANGNLRTFPLDLRSETNCSQMVLGWAKRPNLSAGTGTTMPDGLGGTVTVYEPDLNHPNDIVKCPVEGNVGIGVLQPDFKLTVNGGGYFSEKVGVGIKPSNFTQAMLAVDGLIYSRGLNIYDLSIPFPDYVFAPSYPLKPLQEVENYISKNKHLEGVPTASDIKKDGLRLEELQIKQMEKIEELYLYLISLQKENDTLKNRIQKLEQNFKNK
jgi:hypothetical protein